MEARPRGSAARRRPQPPSEFSAARIACGVVPGVLLIFVGMAELLVPELHLWLKLGGRTLAEPEPPELQGLPRLSGEQLAGWRSYATHRRCSLADADYIQIFQQLLPFRAGGGVREADVRRAFGALAPRRALVSVGGGALAWEGDREQGSVEAYLRDVLPEMAPLLPPIKLLVNLHDEPRSWVAPLPPHAEAGAASGAEGAAAAWAAHACDGAGLAGARGVHALLDAPSQFRGARGLAAPVFGAYTVPGCFGDVLVPRSWGEVPEEVAEAALHAGCPVSYGPWYRWAAKKPLAFWRGSSTGAHLSDATPEDEWRRHHRQRLVNFSRSRPDLLDAAFTAYKQCSQATCARMRDAFGPEAPAASWAQHTRYKYQMVVDGNGAADRLAPALCSGSLVLLASLVRQWFEFRLVPGRHFLSVKLDYSDLEQQVDWARQHDAEARRIVAAAAAAINSGVRAEDARCYLLRLLLEYAALYRPDNGTAAGEAASTAAPVSAGQ